MATQVFKIPDSFKKDANDEKRCRKMDKNLLKGIKYLKVGSFFSINVLKYINNPKIKK